MMMKNEDPPLRSPKWTPVLPSRGRTGLGGGSVSWIAIILSLIFSPKIGIYSVRVEVCGATRWVQPTWARQERGRTLVGCAHPRGPLWQVLAPEILIIDIKHPRKVSFHSENFYFCTKTTPW